MTASEAVAISEGVGVVFVAWCGLVAAAAVAVGTFLGVEWLVEWWRERPAVLLARKLNLVDDRVVDEDEPLTPAEYAAWEDLVARAGRRTRHPSEYDDG